MTKKAKKKVTKKKTTAKKASSKKRGPGTPKGSKNYIPKTMEVSHSLDAQRRGSEVKRPGLKKLEIITPLTDPQLCIRLETLKTLIYKKDKDFAAYLDKKTPKSKQYKPEK